MCCAQSKCDNDLGSVGNREAAQELAGKGKEHAQLAKEARHRANQAAYDSCNLSVTNRFKVGIISMLSHFWDLCHVTDLCDEFVLAPIAMDACLSVKRAACQSSLVNVYCSLSSLMPCMQCAMQTPSCIASHKCMPRCCNFLPTAKDRSPKAACSILFHLQP